MQIVQLCLLKFLDILIAGPEIKGGLKINFPRKWKKNPNKIKNKKRKIKKKVLNKVNNNK